MTIYVTSRRVHSDAAPQGAVVVYIGRPSPLGNPYKIGADGDRDEVIRRYRQWLEHALRFKPEVKKEFWRIKRLSMNNDIALQCWCSPLPCHGDVIKEMLDGLVL